MIYDYEPNPFKARVKETHSRDCERIAFLAEWGRKKEAERMAKAKVEVVVATKKGAICQRRTYRFEDSVHQFFRRLQSVMEVDGQRVHVRNSGGKVTLNDSKRDNTGTTQAC